jgi:glutaminyl-peptide cyclotransferase
VDVPRPTGRRRCLIVLGALGVAVLSSCGANGSGGEASVPVTTASTVQTGGVTDLGGTERPSRPTVHTIEIVATHPHDTALFTQGLEFTGDLLESAGRRGESKLRLYNPVDGTIAASRDVDADLFAEGTTVLDDRIWQLTFQAERVLIYDLDGLQPVGEATYEGEGWGLCDLDGVLVMSNGSDKLTFRRPSDFTVTGSVTVELDGVGTISRLNELECVSGDDRSTVWANVWKSTVIYGIDPETGQVTDVVDASALVPPGFENDSDRVLNGIAVHPDTGRFWLTGKYWPVLYEVELIADGDD